MAKGDLLPEGTPRGGGRQENNQRERDTGSTMDMASKLCDHHATPCGCKELVDGNVKLCSACENNECGYNDANPES
ncbi:hypothetical protein RB598_008459 [Gaeumannomyces tritici]